MRATAGSRGAYLSLLWQLRDGSFVFEGVDEWQDSSFHAGRDTAGHRFTRGRWAAGLLRRGSSHQTLLIAQLRVWKREVERERFKNSSCVWLRRKKVLDRLLPVINSGDYRHRQSFWLSLLEFAYINCSDVLSLNSWWTSLITHAHQTVKPSFHGVLWQRVSSSYRLKIINMSQNGDSTRDFITNLSEQMVWLVQDPSFTVNLDRTALNV